MIQSAFVVLASVLCLVLTAAPLRAQDGQIFKVAPETRERAMAATVLVDLGQRGSGSAFLIHRSGLFVTNRHVVEGIPSGQPVKLVVRSGEEGERVIEGRVALISEEDDLALLKTDVELAIEPLELKEAVKTDLGALSPVIVLGYPLGRRLAAEGQDYPSISINTGRVSRMEKSDGKLTQIQYDAATNPGNSGGPMIMPDGSTVGVVVSGFRGASINFAIPAERVMALIDEPVITFHPTSIPFSDRYLEQDFEIELLANAPLPDEPEVTLHLGAPGPDRRSFPAEFRDGRFHVTTPLMEKPDGQAQLRLQIEAKLADATLATTIHDQMVRLGEEQIPLSSIVTVVEQNGKLKTVLARPDGRKSFTIVDGVPTGLPKLHSEHHGLELSLDKLRGLKVQSYGFAALKVPFEIEVRGRDDLKLTREGRAELSNPPANLTGSSRPKKKDMFSNMFGNDQRSSELDLLSLVDLREDAMGGPWSLDPKFGEISTGAESPSWLSLPARVTDNFLFTLEVVPSADAQGELWIQLPIGENGAMLHLKGGKKGRASVANDPAVGEDDALEFPAFEKGIPFRVQTFVLDGKINTALIITRKSGNATSTMPLPDRLKWSGNPADLEKPANCPLPPGALGVGVSGMAARITSLEISAFPGGLLVSRELPPTIEHHPATTAVHWNLDKMLARNMVQGLERDQRRNDFPGWRSGNLSYAGKALGDPNLGLEPSHEGEGAMRVEGEKAGFQLPSHPRLWQPSFTTAFWFRTDEIQEGERRHLFDEGGRHTGASVYLLGDTLRAGAWDDSAEKKEVQWTSWLKASGIKAGQWYHVALALDSETDDPDTALRLFLNGRLVAKGFGKSLNKNREPGAVGTILGSSRSCPEDPEDTQRTQFVGMIDDFSIHRAALTTDQLALIVGGRFGEAGASFPEPAKQESK